MCRPGYLQEYIGFWSARPEVVRIWMSLYTPQQGEHSSEILSAGEREQVAQDLIEARRTYPKLLMNRGIADAMLRPPVDPHACMFARMSTNFSADLQTRVEPCIFGGKPDCQQCGCAISSGLHWLKTLHFGPLKVEHVALSAATVGAFTGRLRRNYRPHPRWTQPSSLVQIQSQEQADNEVA